MYFMAYNRVEIPTLIPRTLPWNLLTVAENATPSDSEHWMAGASWSNVAETSLREWDPHASPIVDKAMSPAEFEIVSGLPVVLYLPVSCPTSGPLTDADVDRAIELFHAATPSAVESVFWSLASLNASAVGVTGTATSAVGAVGQKLSENVSGAGILHLPAWSAEQYLSGRSLQEDAALVSGRGDRIVVGAGYPSVGTLGTSQLILGSGPVAYLLGEPEVIESPASILDDNTRTLLVESTLVLQFDPELIFSATVTVD